MSTKKKPASNKADLAKGAAEIRKLAAKKPAAPKKAPAKKKDAPPNGALTVLPPIKESKEPIDALLKKHVKIAADFTGLQIIGEIEIGEYLPIFDYVKAEHDSAQDKAEKFQFVLGDLYNEGKRLFGKEFAVLMATNERPVSTLKKWGSIADNIDPALRNLHPALEWSHVAEVAKVPTESGKRDILEAAAKRAESGNLPSVQEIKKEAAKLKPPQKRGAKGAKKVPPYEMEPEEQELYNDFKRAVEEIDVAAHAQRKELRERFPRLTGADKKGMAESLALVVELYGLLK